MPWCGLVSDSKEAAADRTYGERLATLEERMNHVATKAWVLAGVVTGMVIAIGVGLGLARLLQ